MPQSLSSSRASASLLGPGPVPPRHAHSDVVTAPCIPRPGHAPERPRELFPNADVSTPPPGVLSLSHCGGTQTLQCSKTHGGERAICGCDALIHGIFQPAARAILNGAF